MMSCVVCRYGSPSTAMKDYQEFAQWFLPTFSGHLSCALISLHNFTRVYVEFCINETQSLIGKSREYEEEWQSIQTSDVHEAFQPEAEVLTHETETSTS